MLTLSKFWQIPTGMHYNYYLEVCSLIFMVAITIAYFSRKKFPTPVFKLFGFCLVTVSLNLFVNIMACFTLDHSDTIPIIVSEIFNELFFFSQILCSYLIFAYILYSLGKSLRFSPIYNLTIIPSAIGASIILTNSIHHWLFGFVRDGNAPYDYVQGPLFFLLYVIAGLNVFSTLVYIITFRKVLDKRIISVFLITTVLVLASNIIEIFLSGTLLTGLVYTMSMVFIIITINDPDVKVDRISKAYNNDAFIDYINNQRPEKQRKHYIIFDIESFGMFNEAFGVLYSNDLIFQIRRDIELINKKAFIFKTQASRFVLLLRNEDEQIEMIDALKTRFSTPYKIKNKSMNISIHLFYFVNEDCFTNSDTYNDFLNRTLTAINFKDSHYIELDDKFISRVKRDRKIKEILEDALSKPDGFYMVYQPIYDMKNKSFNHFESLIRLVNDELGYVGPGEFIPIAESFGLANDIDFFVLNETCAFLQRNPQIESLEINISCAEFFNNPSERFLKTIKKYNVNPKRIVFEITETVAVKYPSKTKEFMDDLGKYGVTFAMDDFGSGYSNIARFITLPFSFAKLDKSLLEETTNITIFLDSAIQMFHNLNIPIIVEGVETKEQLDRCANKSADYIQGYYFSKPLKEKDLINFLKEKNNL